jgi:hypothetical protein
VYTRLIAILNKEREKKMLHIYQLPKPLLSLSQCICTYFFVVIFFPLMNLVEVDVLLTAPPLGPLKLLRDENDVKASDPVWFIPNKSSNPPMPKPNEPNGLKNEELIVFCGWELRL